MKEDYVHDSLVDDMCRQIILHSQPCFPDFLVSKTYPPGAAISCTRFYLFANNLTVSLVSSHLATLTPTFFCCSCSLCLVIGEAKNFRGITGRLCCTGWSCFPRGAPFFFLNNRRFLMECRYLVELILPRIFSIFILSSLSCCFFSFKPDYLSG